MKLESMSVMEEKNTAEVEGEKKIVAIVSVFFFHCPLVGFNVLIHFLCFLANIYTKGDIHRQTVLYVHTHTKFDYPESLQWDTAYSIIHYSREALRKDME